MYNMSCFAWIKLLCNPKKETYGDVPVWHVNGITEQEELVINNRGMAYAYRNRLIYRKRKDRDRKLNKICEV